MFNPLSSSPFFFNPGLVHQSDNQSRHLEGAPSSDRSVENRPNGVAPARQSYSLSERFSRDDSFSINLTTRDGDQVEITFNSETSYKSDYDLRSGHGREHQRYSIDKEQSSEFGFSVEGNLDVEEIDAIAALVQDLSSLASNFFNGDIQTAMQQVGDLSFDTRQLAELDVSMEQSIEYRAIEKYREIQSMGERAEPSSERAVEPFREQLLNQISRTEQHIEYAAEFTFSLIAEFISHDQRFKEMSEADQESLKVNTERLSELASVKASEAEDAHEEPEHEPQHEHGSDDVEFDD
ncbi:hypothetical protein [Amphritea japonica]|uniref:DUF5610 domain-containing protein n=1 Tax=Amphritea japonica ATCC BAA-1530 TaxID=1278309 RepID=A0A7R6PLD1_9GAMM|nr:hypothetical protein [Amphritea japonica]BBB25603.1 hypothetical protein AMJAP_1006 [Amphritea japonica ATCC BAA-1530]